MAEEEIFVPARYRHYQSSSGVDVHEFAFPVCFCEILKAPEVEGQSEQKFRGRAGRKQIDAVKVAVRMRREKIPWPQIYAVAIGGHSIMGKETRRHEETKLRNAVTKRKAGVEQTAIRRDAGNAQRPLTG
jgi:hypothetical protein